MKHNDSTSLSIVRFHFDLPTTAHRLGYRLREIPSQGVFVQNLSHNPPDPTRTAQGLQALGRCIP